MCSLVCGCNTINLETEERHYSLKQSFPTLLCKLSFVLLLLKWAIVAVVVRGAGGEISLKMLDLYAAQDACTIYGAIETAAAVV